MSVTPILESAPAKINLYLHVTGRRSDGFHKLDSLVVFATIADTVYVRRGTGGIDPVTLDVIGPFAAKIPSGADNLILKAANLMIKQARKKRTASISPIHISLIKRIPAASGIGGGSADAAAAMRALNRLWGWHFPIDELAEMAVSLGSDIPMCLYSQALNASGRGEVISSVTELPKLDAVLINPHVGLETPDVFAALKNKSNPAAKRLPKTVGNKTNFIKYLANCRNDLETPATVLVPEITEILIALNNQTNCHLARMSGSGATCFGLFDDTESANQAVKIIRDAHPNWWVQATELNRMD